MVAHTEKDVWKPVTTRIKIIKNNEQTNKTKTPDYTLTF